MTVVFFFFFSPDNCLLNTLRLLLWRFDEETFIKEYYYVLMCLLSEFLPSQHFICWWVGWGLMGLWTVRIGYSEEVGVMEASMEASPAGVHTHILVCTRPSLRAS